MLVRTGLWVTEGPGAEAHAELDRSADRAIQVDQLYEVFAALHPKIEDMSNDCLEWLRDQISDLGDSPHVSRKIDELERQSEAISTTVEQYFVAWRTYTQAASGTRERFRESLKFSVDMSSAAEKI
jgi:uncharacterized protein YaaR (DUF327 family)